ncbi:MAG: membrane protein insertion efficiency factor YidD [Candidatus Hydrogenedentota bacterium]|nr:MAG: membrane protein insertion efficiency factor YidD [Candidatus Hydrogenedentota bacterium]
MRVIGEILALPVRFYRRFISPLLPPRCRYYPSCSEYTLFCLTHLPIHKAVYLSVKRILKCQPMFPGGIDYPPGWEQEKENTIHQRFSTKRRESLKLNKK